MKTLFLGHFAASVAPRVLAKVKIPLETSILDDEGEVEVLAPLLSEAEIVVGHIWRPSFPPAPRLRLLQSVAAGLDLIDVEAVPKGVTICNVFGHEPAIAEYVIMTMLVLTHRLFETVTAFRAGSWVGSPTFGGGPPHGEVLGRTVGIIGYGRIGREVAERAAGIKCRVVATNRTSVADPAPADTVFPLAELDRMLPLCDTVLISCGLGPETRRLMDARRLALMKPGALSGPAYTTRRMSTFTPTKPPAPRAGELARPPESKAKLGGKSIGDRTPAMTAAGSIPSLTTNGRLMGQAP
jgi:phosphoglycerate dehydrogenase-like enzyme